MHIYGEIILKSYLPKQLELGMLFINKLHQNTNKETIEVWELDKLPLESVEDFITKHGAPVQLYIIDDEMKIIAAPEQIGWWDEGEHTDEYRDITLKDINFIFNEYDGVVNVLIEDDEIVYYHNKVVICTIDTYEEEEEEEEEEIEQCSACNGTGEGIDERPCVICKGTGAN